MMSISPSFSILMFEVMLGSNINLTASEPLDSSCSQIAFPSPHESSVTMMYEPAMSIGWASDSSASSTSTTQRRTVLSTGISGDGGSLTTISGSSETSSFSRGSESEVMFSTGSPPRIETM